MFKTEKWSAMKRTEDVMSVVLSAHQLAVLWDKKGTG